ncbi:MAG: hypothetical protein Kow0092_11630 [Deferrisomatales bacterium]
MDGERIRAARKTKGWSLQELAKLLGVSKTALHRLEQGDVDPGTARGTIARAARVLEAPEILLEHCRECPVSGALLPPAPHLDNVPVDPRVVAHKAAEEAQEAAEALEALQRVMARLDWAEDPDRVEAAISLLTQVRDVEVAIGVLYRSLFHSSLLPASVLAEVARRQHKKCVERGYCRPTGTER